jgi:putative transposase
VARTSAAISGAALWVPPNVHPDEEALDALLRRSVRNRMKRDLAIRALKMAIAFRAPPKGCIHHTDRGSQYCSHDYQKILRQHGFSVSMSGKGNCYDNAAVETFFKTIKAELIWRDTWETRRKTEMAFFEYINGFYNPRRRHSALGWKSPVAFERKVA